MTFRVGQRVICVDASGAPELRLGGVYSVRSFCKCHSPAGVHLDEVEPGGLHCSFNAERFRPAVDRSTETGMAILRRILIDHKTPVREKALSSSSSFRVTGTNT